MPIPIPTCPTCGQPHFAPEMAESLNPGDMHDGRELSARLRSVARALINQPESTFAIGDELVGFVRIEDVGPLALQLVRLAHAAEVLATGEARR
jgi:hypothetical protein